MSRLILDTNVIKWFSSTHYTKRVRKSSKILQSISKGKYEGILIPPVILEVYYKFSESEGETYASNFITNLLSMPNITSIVLTKDIGIFAGKLYYKYNVFPKKSPKHSGKTPGAVDCLLAATNKFIINSIVCTGDRDIHNMSEINSDFWGL